MMDAEIVVELRMVDGTVHRTHTRIPANGLKELEEIHGQDVRKMVTSTVMDAIKFEMLQGNFTLDKVRSIEFRRPDCPHGCGHEEHDGPCGPESSTKKGGVWEP